MSVAVYPEMKISGVEQLGAVPAHWVVTALKRYATFIYGDALAAEIRRDGTTPVFGSNGIVGQHDEANTLAPAIFIGRKGSCGALSWSDEAGFAIDTAYYVDTRSTNASLKWLYWALHVLGLSKLSQDTGVPGLSREIAHESLLAFPPLPEQTAIASFLDRETGKIDELVDEQRQLIALLKEKRQAVISHAVTKGLDPNAPMKDSGIEWLGEVPAHWEVAPLKRHWSVTDCKHLTADFVGDGIPLASIREVQSYFVNLDSAKQTTDVFYAALIEGGRQPEPGDLIFSRNATVGEVAQVADWHPAFAMGQDVCLLRRSDQASSPDFLQMALRSRLVTEQLATAMIGSTFKRVNVEEIRNLTLVFPPASEQADIMRQLQSKVQTFDVLNREAESAIALLQERRAALISAAVTGKINVRGLLPEAVAA